MLYVLCLSLCSCYTFRVRVCVSVCLCVSMYVCLPVCLCASLSVSYLLTPSAQEKILVRGQPMAPCAPPERKEEGYTHTYISKHRVNRWHHAHHMKGRKKDIHITYISEHGVNRWHHAHHLKVERQRTTREKENRTKQVFTKRFIASYREVNKCASAASVDEIRERKRERKRSVCPFLIV